jgi:transcriptional regulator with XRE-family HTH domain
VDDYGQRLTLLVANEIQRLRVERGLSLEALAASAGLHRTSVGLIVRSERGLSVASAATLARALGMRLSDLVLAAEAAADQSPPEG